MKEPNIPILLLFDQAYPGMPKIKPQDAALQLKLCWK